MALSPDILKNLVCSQCQLYLSVLPVKVYPSREIKCARCHKENDGGTFSGLYNEITKHVKFPCKYHYEGCKELLLPSKTVRHERNCSHSIDAISCACSNDLPEFSSLLLFLNHVKDHHREKFLEDLEFYINLDEYKGQTDMFDYVFCETNRVIFINFEYSDETKQVALSIKHLQANQAETIKYRVVLCSLDKTIKINTSSYDMHSFRDMVYIPIQPYKFVKNVITCRIILEQNPKLIFTENYFTQGNTRNRKISIKHTFNQLDHLQFDQKMYSPKYYFYGIPWTICIKKILYQKVYMGIFLETDNNLPNNIIVWAEMLLISAEKRKNKSVVMDPFNFNVSKSWGSSKFIDWTDLYKSSNGFVYNNSLTVVVKVERLNK